MRFVLSQNETIVQVSNVRKLSSSTGTWKWNNFAAGNKDNIDDDENRSQESQVLKKCAELYMSLMPLNEKVVYECLSSNSLQALAHYCLFLYGMNQSG